MSAWFDDENMRRALATFRLGDPDERTRAACTIAGHLPKADTHRTMPRPLGLAVRPREAKRESPPMRPRAVTQPGTRAGKLEVLREDIGFNGGRVWRCRCLGCGRHLLISPSNARTQRACAECARGES